MDQDDPEDFHPPVSPASGAESLFLAGLATSHISATALASQLRRTGGNSIFSMTSADDFVSCIESLGEISDDYLAKTIPELDSNSDSEDDTMPKTKVSSVTPTPLPPKMAPVTAPTTPKPDAASFAYEGAKGVWAWGTDVPVVSTFLGAAEAVAGKALEVAGTTLEEVDGTIKPQITSLDTGILNPAIETVVGIVLGTASKTEEIFKQIISTIMSPFASMLESEPETPEITK